MTYLELQTQFLALLNRRDCTVAMAKAFLQSAIQRIQRDIRVPALEKSVNVVVGVPFSGIVIPTDFLELINLIPTSTQGGTTVTDYKRLEKSDISTALVGALSTGLPRQYCRQGGLWILAPAPTELDAIRVDYYGEMTSLVNDADTNVFSVIVPDLIYYGALSYAGDYFVDNRKDSWEMRFSQVAASLEEQGDTDEQQGASVVMPAFHFPDDLTSDGSNIVSVGY